MTQRCIAAVATALALFGCATAAPPDRGGVAAPPQRIVLHYDFAGDWAATAGDGCAERRDLSDHVFLTIANVPERGPSAFHIARFVFVDETESAEALVGVVDESGWLRLVVEAPDVLAGRAVVTSLELTLHLESRRYVRLTDFWMHVRDGTDPVMSADLLANGIANPGSSELSEAGESGLCLKRL